jgi:hypothetical protein
MKQTIVESISADASVIAGLPYLSHLAERQQLISLHHVLKGLKTLSRAEWNPPSSSDVVLVDYDDRATFDPVAGYYHPQMRVVTGKVIPSSDLLLHQFLKNSTWKAESFGSITVFRKRAATEAAPQPEAENREASTGRQIGAGNVLVGIRSISGKNGTLAVKSSWMFHGERQVIPWMSLMLVPVDSSASGTGPAISLTRGLCVPQGWDNGRAWDDIWTVSLIGQVPAGRYQVRALFYNNSEFAWTRMSNPNAALSALGVVDLGTTEVR